MLFQQRQSVAFMYYILIENLGMRRFNVVVVVVFSGGKPTKQHTLSRSINFKFILKSRKSPASWELFCSRISVTSSTGVDRSTHPRGSVEFVGLVE